MGGDKDKRLTFGHFVDRVFWALICGVMIYAADQLKDMGKTVSDLNEKMAVVISRLSDYDKQMDAISRRLDNLERITRE